MPKGTSGAARTMRDYSAEATRPAGSIPSTSPLHEIEGTFSL